MNHEGTNFGRTSAIFTTTHYYNKAPLDEYGLPRDPNWSHLRDLHKALKLCKKPLLWEVSGVQRINKDTEACFYELEENSTICVAFLSNNNSRSESIFIWRGQEYYMSPHSINILLDCKTMVFNTQIIVAQHNARNFVRSKVANNLKWKKSQEPIPNTIQVPIKSKILLGIYNLLKDALAYAWYTTTLLLSMRDLPMKARIQLVLRIASLDHAMHVFVNGQYVGSGYGSHDEKNFIF